MKSQALLILMWAVMLCHAQSPTSLYVVHTSDTHSCVEPVSPQHKDTLQADRGGFLRRTSLIKNLRRKHPEDMLLLDCGDFSQGSVYYNLFLGETEIKLMNTMRYDACAIGNHEFDFGLENLARLIRLADFPFVCCNYDFRGTPCEGLVKPYVVLNRRGLKIGVFGVSPQPEGLISHANYQPMIFHDPARAAQPIIDQLRTVEKCHLIICLSHLGWGDEDGMDAWFVSRTTGIDLLLGGHTHTLFSEPQFLRDKNGSQVPVSHVGKNGCYIGAMDLEIE